jgi:hypothetical protein
MDNYSQRFHGTAARQLVLLDDAPAPPRPTRPVPPSVRLRLMQKDVYAELTRRRRQAQIAARRWVDESR